MDRDKLRNAIEGTFNNKGQVHNECLRSCDRGLIYRDCIASR